MGADIHIILERKSGKSWVEVEDGLKTAHDPEDRDYERFGALASVRGHGLSPRGIPEDASDYVKRLLLEFHCLDCHSHSYLSLKRAGKIYYKTSYISEEIPDPEEGIKESIKRYFGITDNFDKYRIVFWFDS